MLFAVSSIVLLFVFVSRRRSACFRYWGGVALVGHLVFALYVLPLVPYGWDIDRFHTAALGILSGEPTSSFSAVESFGTFQALVYAVFGSDPTVLSIVNGFLAVLIPLPACYVARRLYPSLESTDGLLMTLLFLPLPFLFTSVPMRDAASTLVTFTLIALVVKAVDEHRDWAALASVPLWGLLFLLREELAVLVLLGAVGAVVVRLSVMRTTAELSYTSLFVAAVPVGLVGFVLFSRLFPVAALNARLQYRSSGGAAYLDFMAYETWGDVLLAAPIRAIYFQFAPFPLHVNSVFDGLAFLSFPVVTLLFVAAYLSIRTLETNSVVAMVLLVVYFGGVIGYGLIDSNFGTTVRHRIVFVFLLGIVSAPALESWLRSLRRQFDERVPDD